MHKQAILSMVNGWIAYADAHLARFESLICDDYYLSDPWVATGLALLALLNGETGDLDCGQIDGLIRDTFEANGFTDEGRRVVYEPGTKADER